MRQLSSGRRWCEIYAAGCVKICRIKKIQGLSVLTLYARRLAGFKRFVSCCPKQPLPTALWSSARISLLFHCSLLKHSKVQSLNCLFLTKRLQRLLCLDFRLKDNSNSFFLFSLTISLKKWIKQWQCFNFSIVKWCWWTIYSINCRPWPLLMFSAGYKAARSHKTSKKVDKHRWNSLLVIQKAHLAKSQCPLSFFFFLYNAMQCSAPVCPVYKTSATITS